VGPILGIQDDICLACSAQERASIDGHALRHNIIAGVMAGRSNGELSADLGLARQTIEAYLSRLFIRFDVTTRTELGILAEREQLLDLPVDLRR
jgi:DNA-binding CsgD family transcriptional regulator